MKVAQLAQLLDGLVQGLSGVVPAGVTADVKSFREAMRPFADENVAGFVAFLAQCEEYKRTGVVAGKARRAAPAKAAADPELVSKAVAAIKSAIEGIDRGEMNDARIDEAMQPFNKYTKPQLDEIAAGLGIAGKPKTKSDAVKKIDQMLRTQARMFDSARAIREG
jgi:hypothetical protein